MAWKERQLSRGRWPLILQAVMAITVLPLRTQLPWYSHPLWLPFALLCAPVLVRLVRGSRSESPAQAMPWLLRRLPLFWPALALVLLLAGVLPAVPAARDSLRGLLPYQPFLLCAGLGWLVGGLALMGKRSGWRLLGAAALGGANVGVLLLLFLSPLWNWELAEQWPVPPVAAMVRRHQATPVRIWRQDTRPSLDWYVGQPVRRLRRQQIGTPAAGWVLSREGVPVKGADCRAIDRAAGWLLLRCR
jgi:hypothetical protein